MPDTTVVKFFQAPFHTVPSGATAIFASFQVPTEAVKAHALTGEFSSFLHAAAELAAKEFRGLNAKFVLEHDAISCCYGRLFADTGKDLFGLVCVEIA